jgi:hypothetical protein
VESRAPPRSKRPTALPSGSSAASASTRATNSSPAWSSMPTHRSDIRFPQAASSRAIPGAYRVLEARRLLPANEWRGSSRAVNITVCCKPSMGFDPRAPAAIMAPVVAMLGASCRSLSVGLGGQATNTTPGQKARAPHRFPAERWTGFGIGWQLKAESDPKRWWCRGGSQTRTLVRAAVFESAAKRL